MKRNIPKKKYKQRNNELFHCKTEQFVKKKNQSKYNSLPIGKKLMQEEREDSKICKMELL